MRDETESAVTARVGGNSWRRAGRLSRGWWLALCCWLGAASAGTVAMAGVSDAQLAAQLGSKDYRVCEAAAERILQRGERMVGPLLALQGNTQDYAGALGNPQGSMSTMAPFQKGPLTREQRERVVTVEAAALYLVSAIYAGSLQFASSALLTDLDVAAVDRQAANTTEYLARGFASARRWSEALSREGLRALRDRGEDPLKSAHLSFW
jgi:hypothetical protein